MLSKHGVRVWMFWLRTVMVSDIYGSKSGDFVRTEATIVMNGCARLSVSVDVMRMLWKHFQSIATRTHAHTHTHR